MLAFPGVPWQGWTASCLTPPQTRPSSPGVARRQASQLICLRLGKELQLASVSPVYRASRSVIVVLKAQLPQQSSLQSCYNQSRLKGQSWGVRGGFDKRAHFSGFSGTLPLAKGAWCSSLSPITKGVTVCIESSIVNSVHTSQNYSTIFTCMSVCDQAWHLHLSPPYYVLESWSL